jgi:hypothetical protein
MALRGTVYRLGTHQIAAYTSAAGATSNAFGAGTNMVRVVPTTAAYVKIGNTPTAAATKSVYMKAGEPEYFVVTPGIKASATGSPCSQQLLKSIYARADRHYVCLDISSKTTVALTMVVSVA